jgi:acyl-coenzyme A thioesterase 13
MRKQKLHLQKKLMENPNIVFYRKYIGQTIRTAPSPLSNWLAGTIREVEEDKLVIEFTVREEMTNPAKLLHGGMIAAIMDDVIGMHLFVAGTDGFYVSVSLHVDFMMPATQGSSVLAESVILRKGKKLISAECRLWNKDRSQLLAKGSAQLVPGNS